VTGCDTAMMSAVCNGPVRNGEPTLTTKLSTSRSKLLVKEERRRRH
jgi:hypothetical protein